MQDVWRNRQTKKPYDIAKYKDEKKEKMIDYSRQQLESLIDEYVIGNNAIRNRGILKDRLIDGLTHEKLAEKYDLSVRQIKNIIYAKEKVVFKHI